MILIFDQLRSLLHGIADGGMGKSEMHNPSRSNFAVSGSPPSRSANFSLTTINSENWSLVIGRRTLTLTSAWARNWGQARTQHLDLSIGGTREDNQAALKLPGRIDDKVADQFPRTGNMVTSRMALPETDSADNRADANPAKAVDQFRARFRTRGVGEANEARVTNYSSFAAPRFVRLVLANLESLDVKRLFAPDLTAIPTAVITFQLYVRSYRTPSISLPPNDPKLSAIRETAVSHVLRCRPLALGNQICTPSQISINQYPVFKLLAKHSILSS